MKTIDPSFAEPIDSDRSPALSSSALGILVFIVTELMFFAALISAYLIIKAGPEAWPPTGQPRLPTFLFIAGSCFRGSARLRVGAIGWLWVDDDIKPIRRVFLSDSRNAWDSRDWSLDWDLATLCKVARGHLEAVFVSGCFVLLVFRSRYLADFVRSGISKLR
ncbi:MAG: hypothetical protein ACKVGW_03250, partial [Verrucomicrobiia bacterium]